MKIAIPLFLSMFPVFAAAAAPDHYQPMDYLAGMYAGRVICRSQGKLIRETGTAGPASTGAFIREPRRGSH